MIDATKDKMIDATKDSIKEEKDMDEDVMKALNPKMNNQSNNPGTSKIAPPESHDSILSQLDQFEPNIGEEPKEETVPQIKDEGEDLLEEAPLPPSSQPTYYSPAQEPTADFSTEQIEEIAESIVDEKWEGFLTKIGDINLWKENVNNELTAIKQEIIRTQDRFTNLQKAILGKVSEYNQNIGNINTEMKALEQVFQKILQPLTTNIKELSRITEQLKKKN